MTTKIERSINKMATLATANGFTVYHKTQEGYLKIVGERCYITVNYCADLLQLDGSYTTTQKAFVNSLLRTTNGLYKDCLERTKNENDLGIYAAYELQED